MILNHRRVHVLKLKCKIQFLNKISKQQSSAIVNSQKQVMNCNKNWIESNRCLLIQTMNQSMYRMNFTIVSIRQTQTSKMFLKEAVKNIKGIR